MVSSVLLHKINNMDGCQLLIQKDALLKSQREKVQELTQTAP
nr:MAG TPA: hypothetical protein [Caudoviricetes sp.]